MIEVLKPDYAAEAERFCPSLKGLEPCPGVFIDEGAPAVYAARVPKRDFDYVFEKERYLSLLAWWKHSGAEPLYISGPAGSGKTSSILQWGAVLNIPVVSVAVRPRMDKRDLVGRWVMGEHGMEWIDGPAALVWRYGGILLINEFSAAPAEMWVSANDILEGLDLEVEQLGIVIPRHKAARVVATDNTRGHAGRIESGFFGRQIQDRSVIDRCWHLRYEGLSEPAEADLLVKRISGPAFDALLAKAAGCGAQKQLLEIFAGLTRFARLTRAQKEEVVGFSAASFPISHRTLIRLSKIILAYLDGSLGDLEDVLRFASDYAIGSSLDENVRAALEHSLKTVLADSVRMMKQRLDQA